MKVNLLYGTGDVLTGYFNINPFTPDQHEYLVRGDVKNIDHWVDDAEATEILAIDVLDYLPIPDLQNVIDHWVKKLRHNGKIVLGGIDTYEVAKAFAQYRLDIRTINNLLHGNQDKPYLIKRSSFTLLGMVNYLEAKHGLKILKKRIANYKMVVEAERK